MSALLVGMLPQGRQNSAADDRPRDPETQDRHQQSPHHRSQQDGHGRGKVTKHAPTVTTGKQERMTRKRATYQPPRVQNAPMTTQVAASVLFVAIAALTSTLITLTIGA